MHSKLFKVFLCMLSYESGKPEKDISTPEDIQFLVDTFYKKVQADPLIGPIFNGAIAGRWDKHLEIMYRFWGTILLEEQTYTGNPFVKHANMPIERKHFEIWLALWHATIGANFNGPKADEAKWRANKMAEVFIAKLDYNRGHGMIPLV